MNIFNALLNIRLAFFFFLFSLSLSAKSFCLKAVVANHCRKSGVNVSRQLRIDSRFLFTWKIISLCTFCFTKEWIALYLKRYWISSTFFLSYYSLAWIKLHWYIRGICSKRRTIDGCLRIYSLAFERYRNGLHHLEAFKLPNIRIIMTNCCSFLDLNRIL